MTATFNSNAKSAPGSPNVAKGLKGNTSQLKNFMSNLVEVTINDAINQGYQLRKEKLCLLQQPNKRDDVNIIIPKPRLHVDRRHNRLRRLQSPQRIRSASPGPNKSRVRILDVRSKDCSTTTHVTPLAKTQASKCSVRIAELAIPKKSHCIETWRTKSAILPDFMLNNLIEHVYDKRPIADISDAINCFNRKPPAEKKHTTCKRKSLPRMAESETSNPRIETRHLCAIFAHKMGQRLIVPLSFQLNQELQRLSDVVADEIKFIFTNKKRINNDEIEKDTIHKEVSDKVAVWIFTILDDAKQKLLEEDLRAKYSIYGGQEDKLILLIEDQLLYLQSLGETPELEEEQGPVLDFIDNLVDNVVDICLPRSGPDSENINEELNETTDDLGSSIYDTGDSVIMGKSDNEDIETEATDTKDFVLTELNGLIRTITSVADNLGRENDEISNTKSKESNQEAGIFANAVNYNIVQNQQENAENLLNENIEQETQILENVTASITSVMEHVKATEATVLNNDNTEVTNLLLIENKVGLEGKIDDIQNSLNTITRESNYKESKVPVELPEEPIDENNKKVKFSEVDMVTLGQSALNRYSNTNKLSISNFRGNSQDTAMKTSSNQNFSNILFGPPNEHLLSEVDETWPDDISILKLKITDSISKSVTSLGRILEGDEKKMFKKGRMSKILKSEEEQIEADVDDEIVLTEIEDRDIIVATKNDNIIKKVEADKESSVKRLATNNDNGVKKYGTQNENSFHTIVTKKSVNKIMMEIENSVEKVIMEKENTITNIMEKENNDIKIDIGNKNIDNKTNVIENESKARTLPNEQVNITLPKRITIVGTTPEVFRINVQVPKTIYESCTDGETVPESNSNSELTSDTRKYVQNSNLETKDKIEDITENESSKDAGKGDHKDESKIMFEVMQQKIMKDAQPKHNYQPKIDYRVDPNSAPPWALYIQPSEDSLKDDSKLRHTNMKPYEIRRWCKEMANVLASLDQWNDWIHKTSKNIILLKQKTEIRQMFSCKYYKMEVMEWERLQRFIDKDAHMWTQLKQRVKEKLRSYESVEIKPKPIAITPDPLNKKSVLEASEEIDRQCLWINRMIMSTEYIYENCTKCTCKNELREYFEECSSPDEHAQDRRRTQPKQIV